MEELDKALKERREIVGNLTLTYTDVIARNRFIDRVKKALIWANKLPVKGIQKFVSLIVTLLEDYQVILKRLEHYQEEAEIRQSMYDSMKQYKSMYEKVEQIMINGKEKET